MGHCPGIEPLLPGEQYTELDDLSVSLVESASRLAGQWNPTVISGIGDLVRSMNCYYSNLIEGHNTFPHDIEHALENNYANEPKKRDLQLEAVAHIELQRLIDLCQDPPDEPTTAQWLCWAHETFCSRLPDELLWVEDPQTGERAKNVPGQVRQRPVIVGQHVPPYGDDLPECLERFQQFYGSLTSRTRKIVSIAASHHRVLWLHPFLDGNGRVARLMSHAQFRRRAIGTSLWSVARGLARKSTEYKYLLMSADRDRLHDFDGRGALSEKALVEFCRFFLGTAIDQVEFMGALLDPANFLRRVERYCSEESDAGRLPKQSFLVLREVLIRGELERGDTPAVTHLKERAARTVVSALVSKRLLKADTSRSALRAGFPLVAVERWFPALYPSGVLPPDRT